MSAPLLDIRDLGARYGSRHVFRGLTFQVPQGHCLGVIGPNGCGKTTLLRALVGLIQPAEGEIRLGGQPPRQSLARLAVAYFGGDATLPGVARADAWGRLGSGGQVTPERRRIASMSRGSRQLLGLRTVLGRHPLALVVLDEPWETLDPDTARWLSATLETKRDKGAAVVVASHRLHDLAGLCDAYLVLLGGQGTLVQAQDITTVGPVTAALLTDLFDKLRGGPPSLRLAI